MSEWAKKRCELHRKSFYILIHSHEQSKTTESHSVLECLFACMCVCVYAYAKWFYSMVCVRVCVYVTKRMRHFSNMEARTVFFELTISSKYTHEHTYTSTHILNYCHCMIRIAWCCEKTSTFEFIWIFKSYIYLCNEFFLSFWTNESAVMRFLR